LQLSQAILKGEKESHNIICPSWKCKEKKNNSVSTKLYRKSTNVNDGQGEPDSPSATTVVL
jgi:hypothetical protein